MLSLTTAYSSASAGRGLEARDKLATQWYFARQNTYGLEARAATAKMAVPRTNFTRQNTYGLEARATTAKMAVPRTNFTRQNTYGLEARATMAKMAVPRTNFTRLNTYRRRWPCH